MWLDGVTNGEERVKNLGQWVWARCRHLQVNRATQQRLKLLRDSTAVKGLSKTAHLIVMFSRMQKKNYRLQLESMLVTHVYPEFLSQFGYMRARVSKLLLTGWMSVLVLRS